MKKKVLKVLIGEAFDKETKRNLPVYASYWEDTEKPGVYSRVEKVFVQVVDLPDKKKEEVGIEA